MVEAGVDVVVGAPPFSSRFFGYGMYSRDAAIIQADNGIVQADESAIMAHEVSHVYGASHCDNNCIMNYYELDGKIYFVRNNEWCTSCAAVIESNRTNYGS